MLAVSKIECCITICAVLTVVYNCVAVLYVVDLKVYINFIVITVTQVGDFVFNNEIVIGRVEI